MSLSSLPLDWDVVVVGAGVAGVVTAYRLARCGCRVLLVEKSTWPRDKPCGGCLNAAALRGLEEAGLDDLGDAGSAYSGLRLACGSRQAEIPLPAGRAVNRRYLDALLVNRAVAQGVHFRSATRATLQPPRGEAPHDKARLVEGRRAIWLKAAGEPIRVTARLVVACDGLGSRLLRGIAPDDMRIDADSPIGLGTTVKEAPAAYHAGAIHMACGAHGYVGLVRVENGALNIGAALDPRWVKQQGGPGAAVATLLAQTRLPTFSALHDSIWQGTPRLTRRRTRLGGERVLVVGDAAGYVAPFTGEGMGWALASAAAVEPLALEAVTAWHDDIVSRWTARHGSLLHARQRGCRGVAAMLRYPRLVSAMLPILNAAPGVAAPFTAWLNRDYFNQDNLNHGYLNHGYLNHGYLNHDYRREPRGQDDSTTVEYSGAWGGVAPGPPGSRHGG
jgi:flavin-dependent dehydrogenase